MSVTLVVELFCAALLLLLAYLIQQQQSKAGAKQEQLLDRLFSIAKTLENLRIQNVKQGDYIAELEKLACSPFEHPYLVAVRRLTPEEGGGYTATIPQLGINALNSTGETPAEALHGLNILWRHLGEQMVRVNQEDAARLKGAAQPPVIITEQGLHQLYHTDRALLEVAEAEYHQPLDPERLRQLFAEIIHQSRS
jgi:hypothetical protein